MEKIITHRGEFLSRSDVLHRVELWRIGGAAVEQPEELRFEADEPLVIEWKETAKHEPICSSSATLRLDSPGDRTYTHLYTITPGAVGMDVYRNGALYWTGTLDAEEYEEPYERAEHYTVSLTFGDFGIWQRLKYSGLYSQLKNGLETIGALLNVALARAGLALPLDESLTAVASTNIIGGGVAKWLGCSPANFYDEDRNPSTLSEAIESLLQPLGLRVVQRVGRLWLYDLHGLHGAATAPPVVWSADSQTLSVDSVANNVRISFSPYASNKLLSSDELKFPHPLHKVWGTLNVGHNFGEPLREWTHPDTYLYYSEQRFYSTSANYFGRGRQVGEYKIYEPAFLLGLADNPNKQYGNAARLCRFLPISEGDEATAYCVKAPQTVTDRPLYGTGVLPKGDAGAIYTTRSVFLPRISNPALYCLRLRVSVLADRALCPIGTPIEKSADKAARDEMDKAFGWAFLSAQVKCFDVFENKVRYFFNNHATFTENPSIEELDARTANNRVKRSWEEVSTNCLLAYFDKSDPSKHSALGGWRTNRNSIGQPNDATGGLHNNNKTHQYDRDNNLPDGELIPYPPNGGWVTITIFNDLKVFPYSASALSTPPPADLKWFAVKAPDLEIVRSWGDCGAPDVPDVEYRATLHPDAKEELAIETKCGTLPPEVEGEPLCRGLYLDALRNFAIGDRDMMRAGVTDRPEQLFINSLYSQYATRHTKLSGEAYIYDGALAPRTEANQGTARFIVVEERQDLIEDCGDVTVVELTPDIYKAVESEENI